MRSKEIVAVVTLAVAALWLFPATAWGHAELASALPKEGKKLKVAPDHLALGFTETPVAKASRVEVLDGCGNSLALAEVYRTEKTLHINVGELGHPGRWSVNYEVLSAEDGHPSGGGYGFKVKGVKDCSVPAGQGKEAPEEPAAEPTATPDIAIPDTPVSDQGSSFPVIPIAVGAIAILGVALLARGAAKG